MKITRNNTVQKTAMEIKKLKVQGSSRVRKAVVSALKKSVEESKAKNANELRKELKKNMLLLASARPTEPEARTAIRIILKASQQKAGLAELKEKITNACIGYEKNREKALKEIAVKGAKELKNCKTVFTHCHSHTVEDILKKMHSKKTLEKVYCTETRPKLQGRITAKNLVRQGIDCTMVVDSAAGVFIKKADVFLTGCDAIFADGSVANKIGTSQISLSAKKYSVPHYIASSSHCFDPATFFEKAVIEERHWKEVWEKKPAKLKIRNPAFDVTEEKLVKAIICEKGVFTPKKFVQLTAKELGITNKKKFSLAEMLK